MNSPNNTTRTSSDLTAPTIPIRTTPTTKSSTSTWSTTSSGGPPQDEGEGEGEIRLNPTTGRPLRNTTPYGRHSNDWLFGSVRVHKSIARKIRRAVGAKATEAGSDR